MEEWIVKRNRFFSVVLIICMLLGMMPVVTLASSGGVWFEFSCNGFKYMCNIMMEEGYELTIEEDSWLSATEYNGGHLFSIKDFPTGIPSGFKLHQIFELLSPEEKQRCAAQGYEMNINNSMWKPYKNSFITIDYMTYMDIYNPDVKIEIKVIKTDGTIVGIDFQNQKPVLIEDITMLPIKDMANALGWSFKWNEKSGQIEIGKKSRITYMTVNNSYVYYYSNDNGQMSTIRADVAPNIINGEVMVPANTLAEAMGLTTEWRQDESCLYLLGEEVGPGSAQIVEFSPANGSSLQGSLSVTNNHVNFQALGIKYDRKVKKHSKTDYAAMLNFDAGTVKLYRSDDDILIWEATENPFRKGLSDLSTNYEQNAILINPTNKHLLLEYDTQYYITMDEGFVTFEDGSVSPAIKKGDWTFTAKANVPNTDKEIKVKFGTGAKNKDKEAVVTNVTAKWKDSWFENESAMYNHELATTAMALSGASYVNTDSDAVEAALKELDFNYIKPHYTTPTKNNNDIVSYTFASKKMYDEDKLHTLVAIIVKGTSGNEEWYSNFNIGNNYENDLHLGFGAAASKVLNKLPDYLKSIGADYKTTKILITGHSRGAAVANLVAGYLNDSENYGNLAMDKNIYGYTFATPAVERRITKQGHKNIFNIVNEEDFVTRVPLRAWGFSRYGVDLTLPNRTDYSSRNFDSIYSKMNKNYKSMTGENYSSYDGTQAVDKVIQIMEEVAPTVHDYYNKKHGVLQSTANEYFGDIAKLLVEKKGAISSTSKALGDLLGVHAFFISNHTIKPRILSAHSMAAYYSWMNTCTAEELFGDSNNSTYREFKRLRIACPVDVFVYDESGETIASVVNEEIKSNTLAVSVEEGVKTIDMPSDQEYFVEVIARDGGTVEYTVEECCTGTSGDKAVRTVAFEDISIKKNDKISGHVDNRLNTQAQNYNLTKNGDTEITPTSDEVTELPFADVSKNEWFYDSVLYAYTNSIMNGVGNGRFNPDGSTNRAMIVTILYRLAGSEKSSSANPFEDVASNQWYTDAVIWAAENGIVSGYGDGRFGPVDNITREQLATILYNYARFKGWNVSKSADLSAFIDGTQISTWAQSAVAWANAEGLINGRTADTIAPAGNATRAETATILMRFSEKFNNRNEK